MKQRIHTDRFNTGAYAQPESTEPIDKFTNRPKMKNSGLKDHLRDALAPQKMTLPKDNHRYEHSPQVAPRGAQYTPAGAFGSVSRTGTGRGVYGYGGNRHSAAPANAVGSPPNRRGGNANGNPPGRRGTNAVGVPPNRRGNNAVGSPPNRLGANALGGHLAPRGTFRGNP